MSATRSELQTSTKSEWACMSCLRAKRPHWIPDRKCGEWIKEATSVCTITPPSSRFLWEEWALSEVNPVLRIFSTTLSCTGAIWGHGSNLKACWENMESKWVTLPCPSATTISSGKLKNPWLLQYGHVGYCTHRYTFSTTEMKYSWY